MARLAASMNTTVEALQAEIDELVDEDDDDDDVADDEDVKDVFIEADEPIKEDKLVVPINDDTHVVPIKDDTLAVPIKDNTLAVPIKDDTLVVEEKRERNLSRGTCRKRGNRLRRA
jgi:hypothetical protein